ncbi:hypothetical protein [Natrialbaceae archaeon AArc-T1-2]|uniref:hypothetical protein n=1 Tax=Natrialbaceae archaeon AArc-T1-2 TaxID=3053904 RepID=UPI00255AA774|nr:hypothetical protein [Natrialbaceae archaeon AArc-T1-2]WIV67746.1 hypothetical protein QQ977_03165 [Natrialbaceae archaeon AArc-T1-2]
MVDFELVLGIVWIVFGVIILIPAYFIAFRGRADFHVNYDESVDPAYVSRWAGTTALLMGLLVVAYGLYQLAYGYSTVVFGALLVSLLVLSSLTKRFAQGWGAD